jgi:hypothetical protein
MRAPPTRHALPLGIALVALLAQACNHNRTDEFPLSVGYQPLEALSPAAAWPAATATDPTPQGLGAIVAVPSAGHYTSHARGYLHAPLAKVYEALKDPAASYIHNTSGGPALDGPPVLGVEPFPVSFRVRYVNSTIIGPVKFDITYRAGPLDGTEAAPVVVGERYQKTWGTDHITLMAGSLVATEVPGAPGVTSVEMIAWLKAETQHQGDCDGTLSDLFGDLAATLAAMP